ncbi:aminoglycoside phosphotransferase family protein [Streptomyces sp. NPDC002004]
MAADILDALRARACRAAHGIHGGAAAAVGAAPASSSSPAGVAPGRGDGCGCEAPGHVLADRDDATVVRHGDVVAKAHAPGTDAAELTARTAVAAHPALRGILLPPVSPHPTRLDDRPVTLWPHGSPVDPRSPESAPWEEAATLLARLHRVRPDQLPARLPEMRGPAKAAHAVARLRRTGPHPAAAPVLRAWSGLPAWARAAAPLPAPTALCHGDLHLGQLVRHPAGTGPWLLIDVDDLGLGDPAWDLARPAAWYACGLLGPEEWARFLAAYQRAGGPAVPAEGDPWSALEVPARALTVQTAARAITKSVIARRDLDDVECALVDACRRMAAVPTELAPGITK